MRIGRTLNPRHPSNLNGSSTGRVSLRGLPFSMKSDRFVADSDGFVAGSDSFVADSDSFVSRCARFSRRLWLPPSPIVSTDLGPRSI